MRFYDKCRWTLFLAMDFTCNKTAQFRYFDWRRDNPLSVAEAERKILEMAYAQRSGCSKCCDALGGFADQDVVGGWSGAGADAEQGTEGGMPRPAPIEAEHELVEVVLEVGFPQSVVDAQAPTLEV